MPLDWKDLQEKWQKAWAKADLGKASVQKNKEKFFMIFAYPGISGYLHVGHMRGFSYTDAICRYERLQGKEVLFPVGTHASGNQALAFAKKVENGDAAWLEYLRRNGCPEKQIAKLADPQNVIAFFNQVYVNDYWKKFGFLCDWERFTCTTFPDYEKFIHWQFKKLQQKDLLVQKPYFATACTVHGPVAVDPSETDISKGGTAEKQEYTLLKFPLGDGSMLIAATLRPETIFGQTNLWINPSGQYVRVDVDGEPWIISREAAEKLQYQKDDVLLKEDVDPKRLLGKTVKAPGIGREIPILPASFCNPAVGTGIVTSVPGDAPYDYVALKHLQDNLHEAHRYGLNEELVQDIDPIPIIATEGYGEFPAKEIVEKMCITSLDDPRLEEATKEVYKKGYHTGRMRESAGKYAGLKVEEAKEKIKAELLERKEADVFHDLSEEVLCRCGNKVVIQRIDDQWFIRYSNQELTERSKEHVREMAFFPEEYGKNMPAILDWFGDRACARLGNWLGSRFPFDERWIIEPISDSTLYPVYYIVSKYVHNGTLSVKDLTEEFFDYVFLGKGTGKETWKPIKEEFDYFYPLDINLGGKEHQTVHFPVFLMSHVAVLPEEKWPKGIFVNWWVIGKGSKISKSKGGAEPIPQAIEKYGVDAMRLYYAHSGSPHTDVVWDEEAVFNYKRTLEKLAALAEQVQAVTGKKKQAIDVWLQSRFHGHLHAIEEKMRHYDLRELASIAYYTIADDFRWYLRRGGANKAVVQELLSMWCRLLNPLTPHLSEELNPTRELVSASSWPKHNKMLVSLKAEAGEELVKQTEEDMRITWGLAKLQFPHKYTLFVAEAWKYELCTLLSHELKVTRDLGAIMRKVLETETFQLQGKEVSKIVGAILKDPSKLPTVITSPDEEVAVLEDAKTFFDKEILGPMGGLKIEIIRAEESDHPKGQSALPGKVGIFVE